MPLESCDLDCAGFLLLSPSILCHLGITGTLNSINTEITLSILCEVLFIVGVAITAEVPTPNQAEAGRMLILNLDSSIKTQ
jgi:hypothetical protein